MCRTRTAWVGIVSSSFTATIEQRRRPSAPLVSPETGRTSVASGEADLGVAVCGSGIGISIAANKVPGVRAALAHDATSARLAREHNHANVLCLGARLIGPPVAQDALAAWLGAEPGDGRHLARIDKLSQLDQRA